MKTLSIPLQQWGSTIAGIDIDASLESVSEQDQGVGDLTDYLNENYDFSEGDYSELQSEVDMLYTQAIERRLYENICSCIETATEHVIGQLSPDTYSPINYTTGMSDVPDNFPSVEWEMKEGNIIFTEKSCHPLALAIMACMSGWGSAGDYFGVDEFHYTYSVSDITDLADYIGWLGKYWAIFGDSRPKVDYDNLDCYFSLDAAIEEAAKGLDIKEED